MKTVLVTGGYGFIGSNFIRFLLQNPAFTGKIVNIDKITYAANPTSLSDIEQHFNPQRYCFEQVDICEPDKLTVIFNNYKPDTVVNFAAESHVDRSILNPLEFIRTNVLGTGTLLHSALEYYLRLDEPDKQNFRFLHISTDEVYGSLSEVGSFSENSPYDPSSPYSASKAGSDHLVRAWQKTYKLPVLITNCSNNYGPYQFPEKLIPLTIINCLSGKPIPVYGKGLNVRDWLYVLDHCEAIQLVIEKGKIGETYNIGAHNEKRNIEVVFSICENLDVLSPAANGHSYKELINYVTDRPGHDLRYAIDASKIQKELGWIPHETFQTGIRQTIQWYLDNKDWWQNIKDNKYRQQNLGLPA